MRLVACRECHTQFDVSEVTSAEFLCRCGATVANREHEAVDVAVHRCGSCGAQVGEGAERCEYCGSDVRRETWKLHLICPECGARNADDSRFCTGCGVGFDPESPCEDALEHPCPVCSCLMPARRLGKIGINECPQCNGLWVPENRFDELVDAATESRHSADPNVIAAYEARKKGGNPYQQKVAYRKCPVCEAFMLRRNFRKSSGVIIDRCGDHGTWLDADELEQIVGFVLSGGRPESTARLEADEAEARAAYVRARVASEIESASRSRGLLYSSRSSSRDGFDLSLTGILKTLLG